MYQPALRPDQVRALYFLKLRAGRPMTRLLREAVDGFLAPYGGPPRVDLGGRETAEPDEPRRPVFLQDVSRALLFTGQYDRDPAPSPGPDEIDELRDLAGKARVRDALTVLT